MCGIAGVVGFNCEITSLDIEEGRKMTAMLRHRGPDYQGDYYDKHCFLGNTRLKILDLSAHGNMPFANDDRTIWISYNGEVTNFKELIDQFQLHKKYDFRSATDTEVVLRLYEELGIGCLQHLSGQFAFTIYDQRKQLVYIVRDPFGLRPVFYMQKNGRVYFASEIKSFLELQCFSGKIDYQAMYNYFSLIYIPGQNTPYSEVKELDGGHLLKIDLKTATISLEEYYKIFYQPDNQMTEKEACDLFYDAMRDSMRRNLISDAPLGITLSGGLDTSTMLALAKELGQSQKLHTFSLKINESSFDESPYQQIMVDYAQPIHHQIEVNPEEVLNTMITQMAYMDEPNGNGAVIPSFLLAKEASKYVKVLLSGEGGDELTNAYDTHLAYEIRKRYKSAIPKPLRNIIYKAVHLLPVSNNKLSVDFLAKRFTEGVEKNTPEAHLYWRHVFTEEEKHVLLSSPYNNYPPTDRLFADTFSATSMDEELSKISFLDWKYFFIGDLMVKNDRTFMAHSVEARFPFADTKLFAATSKIPAKYRIKGLTARYFQKKAMQKILPKEIYRRKSMGLEMPHSLWFFQGLAPLIDSYLTKKNIEKVEIFNYDYVQLLWQQHKSKKKDNGRALWSILNYLIWFDLFIEKKNYKDYLRT